MIAGVPEHVNDGHYSEKHGMLYLSPKAATTAERKGIDSFCVRP